jgi:hypothetical protein
MSLHFHWHPLDKVNNYPRLNITADLAEHRRRVNKHPFKDTGSNEHAGTPPCKFHILYILYCTIYCMQQRFCKNKSTFLTVPGVLVQG